MLSVVRFYVSLVRLHRTQSSQQKLTSCQKMKCKLPLAQKNIWEPCSSVWGVSLCSPPGVNPPRNYYYSHFFCSSQPTHWQSVWQYMHAKIFIKANLFAENDGVLSNSRCFSGVGWEVESASSLYHRSDKRGRYRNVQNYLTQKHQKRIFFWNS